MKTMLAIWKVAALSALLLLMLTTSALAQQGDLEFDEDDCSEVEEDGEAFLLCEDDDGTLYVCVEAEEEDPDAETPAGDDGEVDGVAVICVEFEPEIDDDDDEDGVGAGGAAGGDTTPTGGVATGAGGTAPTGVPAAGAAAALGALVLAGAAAMHLRRA